MTPALAATSTRCLASGSHHSTPPTGSSGQKHVKSQRGVGWGPVGLEGARCALQCTVLNACVIWTGEVVRRNSASGHQPARTAASEVVPAALHRCVHATCVFERIMCRRSCRGIALAGGRVQIPLGLSELVLRWCCACTWQRFQSKSLEVAKTKINNSKKNVQRFQR